MCGDLTQRFSGRAERGAAVDEGVSACAKIRRYRTEDAEAVRRILEESPEAADWSKEGFEETSRLNGVLTLVSDKDGEVGGFIVARQIADEAEVLNLAVRRDRRRSGQGGGLLEAALAEFKARGVSRVYLEVRESNAVATMFYERHGFRQAGKRKGYYRNPDEAAVLLERKLTG
jgi:[ribosomal protein S18]-alanine N-acetyltransferase